MTKNKATFLAFLTAPFVSSAIGITQTATFGPLDLSTFFGLLPIFYSFSFMAMILFGLPIFLLFRRYNVVKWWSTLGAGIIVGALAAVIFMLPNAVQIGGLITMSVMGGASSFVFWLIWNLGSECGNLGSDQLET